jgi:histone H1/5
MAAPFALTNEMAAPTSIHCLKTEGDTTFECLTAGEHIPQTQPKAAKSRRESRWRAVTRGMSTKTYLEMVCEAIPIIRDRKGASRAAIAKWIQENCSKEAGAMFNARLRTALNKGIEKGVLKEGNTPQRFRIGVLPKPTKPKPKKKVVSKKKTASKKKKTASKRKKPASKKKSASKKKKSASKKKKPASKKKKPAKKASKKKSSSKKKKAAPKRRSRK